MNLEEIDSRLQDIESRNKRVENNKSWELSWIRRVAIALLTYFTIVVYHLLIGADNAFVISLVPVLGFVLSTLSLQFIRQQFEKRKSN